MSFLGGLRGRREGPGVYRGQNVRKQDVWICGRIGQIHGMSRSFPGAFSVLRRSAAIRKRNFGSRWTSAKKRPKGAGLSRVRDVRPRDRIDGEDQCDSRGPDSRGPTWSAIFAKTRVRRRRKCEKNGREIGARETAVWESDIGVARWVCWAQDFSRIKGGKVTRLSAW